MPFTHRPDIVSSLSLLQTTLYERRKVFFPRPSSSLTFPLQQLSLALPHTSFFSLPAPGQSYREFWMRKLRAAGKGRPMMIMSLCVLLLLLLKCHSFSGEREKKNPLLYVTSFRWGEIEVLFDDITFSFLQKLLKGGGSVVDRVWPPYPSSPYYTQCVVSYISLFPKMPFRFMCYLLQYKLSRALSFSFFFACLVAFLGPCAGRSLLLPTGLFAPKYCPPRESQQREIRRLFLLFFLFCLNFLQCFSQSFTVVLIFVIFSVRGVPRVLTWKKYRRAYDNFNGLQSTLT